MKIVDNIFQLNSKSKIFIVCPNNLVTGGAELLHQLCSLLNDNNRDAYIVYYGEGDKSIPDDYKKYNLKLAFEVDDAINDVVVLCEVFFNLAFKFKNLKILFWWLSVDNLYLSQEANLSLKDYFAWNKNIAIKALYRKLKGFLKLENRFLNNFKINDFNKLECIHGYQSEYAKSFLLKNNIENIVSLKDYINLDFMKSNSTQKENIIIYNPKKGLAFTRKLIKLTPDLLWIPIENMSRNEVGALIRKSKLYVDFGYHPGKDRLPREAAINNCCIITGKLGAAAFFEDISIESDYKFGQEKTDIPKIIIVIRDVLNNYDRRIKDFEYYRNTIFKEQEEFRKDVLNLFSINY